MFEFAVCLNCGKELVGRSDKKFCDIHCKAQYNNQRSKEKDAVLHKSNRLLRKNRSILKTLCVAGKATVRREELVKRGFTFEIYTYIWKSRSGYYYFSYEWGFMPIVDPRGIQKAVIIQRQDYMNQPYDPWAKLR
jgi:hypothetical protein